ncbi:hypothetical protein BpHYR1_030961 [Brachionus plicatilis]|uniref:Uncharacterized protein n=1 Tax=Brachionus plicatilis TaxID=10195 RepID=A0A3M7SWA4_BRAPC|nr:hypothetical protein BpHYR1_030961 [Brachionus plicatilis]
MNNYIYRKYNRKFRICSYKINFCMSIQNAKKLNELKSKGKDKKKSHFTEMERLTKFYPELFVCQ